MPISIESSGTFTESNVERDPQVLGQEFRAFLVISRMKDLIRNETKYKEVHNALVKYLELIRTRDTENLIDPAEVIEPLLEGVDQDLKSSLLNTLRLMRTNALRSIAKGLYTIGTSAVLSTSLNVLPANTPTKGDYNQVHRERVTEAQTARSSEFVPTNQDKLNVVDLVNVQNVLQSEKFQNLMEVIYKSEGKGQTVDDSHDRGGKKIGGRTNSGLLEDTFVRLKNEQNSLLKQLAKSNPSIGDLTQIKDLYELRIDQLNVFYAIIYLESGADKFPPELELVVFDTHVLFGERAAVIYGRTPIRTNSHAVGEGLEGRLPPGMDPKMISFPEINFRIETHHDALNIANQILDNREMYHRYISERAPDSAQFVPTWLNRVAELRLFINELYEKYRPTHLDPGELDYYYHCKVVGGEEVGKPVFIQFLRQKRNSSSTETVQELEPPIELIASQKKKPPIPSVQLPIPDRFKIVSNTPEKEPAELYDLIEKGQEIKGQIPLEMLPTTIVDMMEKKGMKLFKNPGEVNIINVEGMFPDGKLNLNTVDQFNDARILITFVHYKGQKVPIIIGSWYGNVSAGEYFLDMEPPSNPLGNSQIEKDKQYKAWKIGTHHGSKPELDHEALVQSGPVMIRRDKLGSRGDWSTSIPYWDEDNGLNIHYNNTALVNGKARVGKGSRGCPTLYSKGNHEDFLAKIKLDPRYQDDHEFVYTVTFLTGDALYSHFNTLFGTENN